MQNHGNKELHSVLLQSLAALREYDKVARWDEDMQDEVRALLMKMLFARFFICEFWSYTKNGRGIPLCGGLWYGTN